MRMKRLRTMRVKKVAVVSEANNNVPLTSVYCRQFGVFRGFMWAYTANLLSVIVVSLVHGWKPCIESVIQILAFAIVNMIISPILFACRVSNIHLGWAVAITAETINFIFYCILFRSQSRLVQIGGLFFILFQAILGLDYLFRTML